MILNEDGTSKGLVSSFLASISSLIKQAQKDNVHVLSEGQIVAHKSCTL